MNQAKNDNNMKGLEWCPETDLNRRHADFQSAALPTELSGHPCSDFSPCGGVGVRRKWVGYSIKFRAVQHPIAIFIRFLINTLKCRFHCGNRYYPASVVVFFLFFNRFSRNDIASRKPAIEIDAFATWRAERIRITNRWLTTFRAGASRAQRCNARTGSCRYIFLVAHGNSQTLPFIQLA